MKFHLIKKRERGASLVESTMLVTLIAMAVYTGVESFRVDIFCQFAGSTFQLGTQGLIGDPVVDPLGFLCENRKDPTYRDIIQYRIRMGDENIG